MTWLMIFVFYAGGILQTVNVPTVDVTSCIERLDKQYKVQIEAGIQQEHMVGWCVDTKMETLEMKPSVETKPEFLK